MEAFMKQFWYNYVNWDMWTSQTLWLPGNCLMNHLMNFKKVLWLHVSFLNIFMQHTVLSTRSKQLRNQVPACEWSNIYINRDMYGWRSIERKLARSVAVAIAVWNIFAQLLKSFIANVLKCKVGLKINFKYVCVTMCISVPKWLVFSHVIK